MSEIHIPKEYAEAFDLISTMGQEDFDLLLNAASTLPLEMEEHMLLSSFQNRLGEKREEFKVLPAAIIGLAGLHKIHGGYAKSIGEKLAKAVGEKATAVTAERIAKLYDSIASPIARRHALDSFGEDHGLVDCTVRPGISFVPELFHDGKPIAYSAFTLHLTYGGGGSKPSQSLVLDMPLADLRELKQAVSLAIHQAEKTEKVLKDQFSFIRQEEYGEIR